MKLERTTLAAIEHIYGKLIPDHDILHIDDGSSYQRYTDKHANAYECITTADGSKRWYRITHDD